jgi:hypothetical protein
MGYLDNGKSETLTKVRFNCGITVMMVPSRIPLRMAVSAVLIATRRSSAVSMGNMLSYESFFEIVG